MKVFQKIYQIVAKIPRGKVMTYKQVADIARTNPRIVGFALNKNKNPKLIPCHRVVKSNGKLANGYIFGGKEIQKKKLKEEGVVFINKEIIDLKVHVFKS